MLAAAGEAERKMTMVDEISQDEEIAWLLRGRFLADAVLEKIKSPRSHLETATLQSARSLVEGAVETEIHGDQLAGADPRCRQLISEGAFLAYNEWATKDMVFSEETQSE